MSQCKKFFWRKHFKKHKIFNINASEARNLQESQYDQKRNLEKISIIKKLGEFSINTVEELEHAGTPPHRQSIKG